MKPILDHIGIAVGSLDEAIAFYTDALGLDAHAPEAVATEQVRVQSLQAGGPTLELLEATGPDSPIARFGTGRDCTT
jgi:catechol 2,3-dioxygenase-like lactoylglutathione lyase family enzyme